MPTIVFMLSLVAMGAAVGLASFNMRPARRRALGVTVRSRPAEGKPALPVWLSLPFPLLRLLAPLSRRIVAERYRTKAATELQKAGIGRTVTVDHLLALKAIAAIVTPLLLSRMFHMFTNPAMFLAAGVGGFYLPDHLIKDLRHKRERQILRALPGAVDVLSLSVEAGLEFLAAIQRLLERGGMGPLQDELATILNDIRLGESRMQALKTFAARVEIPEVGSFVSVLVQADMLGSSIGSALRSQAERMRVERFQRAEKAGARATQKILVPLVLFIFPAVLIVIMGPVVLQLAHK